MAKKSNTRKTKKASKKNMHNISIYVCLCLLLYFLLGLWGAMNDGVTADEVAHLPAGYSYLKTGSFEMNYEHPPLVKLLAGAPLLFADVNQSAFHIPAWEQGNDGEWVFGNHVLFKSKTPVDTLLLLGRIPVLLLGVLLGLLIFFFARDLFGEQAALVSLALYAVLPEALAHGHLVTTDMGVALGILAAVYYWYKYVSTDTIKYFYLCAIITGLAMSAKFTGVYLFAILGILFIAHKMRQNRPILDSFVRSVPPMIKVVVISLVTLVLTYRITQFGYFFKGLRFVSEHSVYGHQAFLFGMRSFEGWWYYFPAAFLVKTPLVILASLCILAYVSITDKQHPLRTHWHVLFIPVILYMIAFMVNAINIGVRHIFPIYPFLLIAIGSIVLHKQWKKVLIALVAVQVVITILIAPHFLSYFNFAVGGPSNGHNYLLDSNIDWGQDLKGLQQYQQTHPEKLHLAYFGNDNATERGIHFSDAKCYPQKGVLAISVNQLQGIREKSSRCFTWLREGEYKPFHTIGYSIHLYRMDDEINETQQRLQYCASECKTRCRERGLLYKSSGWDQKCKCSCLGPKPSNS